MSPDQDSRTDRTAKLRLRLVLISAAIVLLWMKELERKYPSAFGVCIPRTTRFAEWKMRERETFDSITNIYSDRDFRRAFRMDRRLFRKLLNLIRAGITKNDEMGRRSGRPTIKPDVRLAVTLRMLAGASYLDLMTSYKIFHTAVFSIFHSTCDVLMRKLRLPGLPRTIPGLRRIAEEFRISRSPPSPLSGCVGALDGIAVKIKKPDCCLDPACFWCRKGYYAIPFQALVDSNYQFLSYSARCVGSTQDSLAHSVSSLGRYLEAGHLKNEFWIAGDEAYVCTESLITPFPASQASDWQDSFNFWHSSLRMHVEQSFGMLVAKWRILLNLNFSVEVNAKIICLAMKSHNYCIDNMEKGSYRRTSNAEVRDLVQEDEEWYEEAKEDAQEANEGYRNTQGSASRKRDRMVELVKSKVLMRPVPRSAQLPEHGRLPDSHIYG